MYLKQQILRVIDDNLLVDTLSMHLAEASKASLLIREGNDDPAIRRYYEGNDEVATLANDELTRRVMLEGGKNNPGEYSR